MHIFEGDTASQVWNEAMRYFSSTGGNGNLQHSRTGDTQELLHACFVIENPTERWILNRLPAMNPAFAIAEVIWIISGREDAHFLNYWNRQLPKFAGNTEIYPGAYGFRLRNHFGIDQIDRAYHALDSNPAGRQVVLQLWDATHDFPNEHGQPQNKDIPCNTGAFLKIRNNKLEWMQLNRSNDMYLGVPHNFIQFTSLQEIIAGWLGVDVGQYHHISDSLHIYARDLQTLKIDNSLNIVQNTDSLQLPKQVFDRHLKELEHSIDFMLSTKMNPEELKALVSNRNLPSGFQNMLIILATEFARRNEWYTLLDEVVDKCSNPVFTQAWVLWNQRVRTQHNS